MLARPLVVASWLMWASLLAAVPAEGQTTSSRDTIHLCTVLALDEASVSAREAGQLIAVDVRETDQVEVDAVLAQIDAEDIEMAWYLAGYEYELAKMVAASDIEIRVAEKSRDVAQATLEDALDANKRSTNKKIFTDAELRKRRFEVERADASTEFTAFEQQRAKVTEKSKLAQLKRAEAALARHRITAPIKGEVVELMRRVGEWVSPGDPVLRIVRMDKLKVEGPVKAADWPRQQLIRRKVQIVVQAPGGGTETFSEAITGIGSMVEGADEYKVWAEIDNRREGDTWVITPGLKAEMVLLPR